jgi:hypothetical protein
MTAAVRRPLHGPGLPAGNGEFYGERKELSLDEIKTIVTGHGRPREDCVDPSAVDGTETAAIGGEAKEGAGDGAPAESAAAAEGGTHEVAASSH